MLKLFRKFIVLSMICAFTLSPLAMNTSFVATPNVCKQQTATAEATRAPQYEWRIKIVDGKLYRRLFCITTGEWIGEWELCA